MELFLVGADCVFVLLFEDNADMEKVEKEQDESAEKSAAGTEDLKEDFDDLIRTRFSNDGRRLYCS